MTILMLSPDAGVTYSFLGSVATVKAGHQDTAGALSVIECECPPGWATPMHLHERDDEAFYIVSGAMRLWNGDEVSEWGQGSFVLTERNRPHAFAVFGDEPLRVLQLHWPSGFEKYVADVAAIEGPPEPALLSELAGRQGIKVLGPPPA